MLPRPNLPNLSTLKNIDFSRNSYQLWKLFLQYCEYTSIGGFRFFTPLTPRHIRIPATFLFGACIGVVVYQILYTLTSYASNTNIQYSTLQNSHFIPLPFIFICKPFDTEKFFPFWELCQNGSTAPLTNQEVITRCLIIINGRNVHCDFRCVWSAQGFCIAVTPNKIESYVAVLEVPEMSNASLNATPFEVYLEPYDRSHAKHWYCTHPFSVRPSNGKIYPRASTHIYINEHYELKVNYPLPQTYENCIWKNSEELLNRSTCNYTKFAPWNRPISNFTVPKPLKPSDCVAKALRTSIEKCVPNREKLETYMCNMVVLEDYVTPTFFNNDSIFGNLKVALHTVRSRTMYNMKKPQTWKLASDIGGTLSLYTGFTLMGILETMFFLSSYNLRSMAAQDEQTEVERKNPPIRNPTKNPMVKKLLDNIVKIFNKLKKVIGDSRLALEVTKLWKYVPREKIVAAGKKCLEKIKTMIEIVKNFCTKTIKPTIPTDKK